jgi:hypothetical protein
MNEFNLPELSLPRFLHKIRIGDGQRTEIFDEFRKRFVALTPEEWVRQHMLHYLVNYLSYPAGLLGVEVSLSVKKRKQRADIVVYLKNLSPWMIVECKAPDVETGRDTFMQAVRYNADLRVPFLVITNGKKLNAIQINGVSGETEMLTNMPEYPSNQ